ncbi:MAG: methyltransferase domain-containing protein [Romboutsia sp.]|uniref:methyltransferase domain-containing protein n=1 Tax=Romboutsia sp. TaxID=1965302 RepID=UPI003F2E91F5
MISVIMLNLENNKTYNSIRNLEKLTNIEEIIIVNILKGTKNYESSNLKIITINTDSPCYSFSQLLNKGIKSASKENDIFIMNDNCYINNDSLNNLEKAIYSSSNIAIATPISNIGPPNYYQSLNLSFDSFENYIQYIKDQSEYDKSKNEIRLRTALITSLIKRSALNDIGDFDELFNSTHYVSDDFCLRALKKGYKTLFCNHSFSYISGDLYFNMPMVDKANFVQKWKFDSVYSLTIRNEILDKIVLDKSKKINILEIGCACGSTLLRLKSIYKDCELYGLDIDKDSIDIAQFIEGANIKVANIEDDSVVFENEQFDLIIALDVLEHLNDPWAVMQKLNKYLKKDGQIIVSIPNIMHISIVNNLIRGSWDYQDCGILDRTHLRFFTLKSMNSMFDMIGYSTIYYFSTPVIVNNEEQELLDLLINKFNLDKNQLLSYQYLITNKI